MSETKKIRVNSIFLTNMNGMKPIMILENKEQLEDLRKSLKTTMKRHIKKWESDKDNISPDISFSHTEIN